MLLTGGTRMMMHGEIHVTSCDQETQSVPSMWMYWGHTVYVYKHKHTNNASGYDMMNL